jgi:hypothetical protein
MQDVLVRFGRCMPYVLMNMHGHQCLPFPGISVRFITPSSRLDGFQLEVAARGLSTFNRVAHRSIQLESSVFPMPPSPIMGSLGTINLI